MKRITFFFIMVLSGLTLFAQTPKINFVEYDLPNGLHVILHKDNSTPIVAVSIMYHVGSKNEEPNRTGFAHFFEHLMFEGSEHIERGEYSNLVESAGGALNAYTSLDKTYYYEILPSNQLALGLWLESERLRSLRIDSIGVETQREVVKEERRLRYDNQPYGSFFEETLKRAYKVHPYQWPPIGSAQYIDQAKLDEFIGFHNMFYVPGNAVLSIAGDIDIDETKELIEKYFGNIPKADHKIYRPDVVEPPQESEVRDTVYDNIQLPLVLHAYHMPAQGTDDYYALQMLTTLLSGGQSSRLYKELVDNKQAALFVGSFPLALEDPGLFITYAIANAGVTADSLEMAMQIEIEKVKNELISQREFEKLQNQTEADFITQSSRVASIAENLANYYLFFGSTNLINTELSKYMNVTREDIQSAAEKYLTKDNRVVLYYLPKPQNKEN